MTAYLHLSCGLSAAKPPTGVYFYDGGTAAPRIWRFMVSAFGIAPYIDFGIWNGKP